MQIVLADQASHLIKVQCSVEELPQVRECFAYINRGDSAKQLLLGEGRVGAFRGGES